MGDIRFQSDKIYIDYEVQEVPKCPSCNTSAVVTIHTLDSEINGYSCSCPWCNRGIEMKDTFKEAVEEWSRIGEAIGDCEYYENSSGGRCLGTKERDCVSCRGDKKSKHCVYYDDFNKGENN